MDYKVSIHQPNYIPWIGYFYKMYLSDCFVLQSNVQYSKKGYTRRCLIPDNGDSENKWLTVPLLKHSDFSFIADIKIDHNQNWQKKHLSSIESHYRSSPFFDSVFDHVVTWFKKSRELNFLHELNEFIIISIKEMLSINCMISQDEYEDRNNEKNERIIEIVKKNKGTSYLSGSGGKKYIDETLFEKSDITLEYYNIEDFIKYSGDFNYKCSILDPLFTIGPDGIKERFRLAAKEKELG